jgi:hypothetical protein
MGNCKTTGCRPLGLGLFLVLLILAPFSFSQPYLLPIPNQGADRDIVSEPQLTFRYNGEGQTLFFTTPENTIIPYYLPTVSVPSRVILSGLGEQGFTQVFTMGPPVGLEDFNLWYGAKTPEGDHLTIITDGTNTAIYPAEDQKALVFQITLDEALPGQTAPGEVQGGVDRSFLFSAGKGTEPLFFYPKLFGGRIDRVSIDTRVSGLSLLDPPEEGNVPIADLGTIFAFSRLAEGLGPYRFVSWNRRPSIKFLIFEDYPSQSAHLRRLAFFVEKRGFRGTLLSNEMLARMHGWNAHNYRAQDLAAFYQKAQEDGVSLNPEELDLRDRLVEWEIIRVDQGRFVPGEGAILSFAKVTAPLTRERFVKHEFVHGLYFVSEIFEEKVAEIWGQTPETFKTLWASFLTWASYDAGWDYLVINELAGYLLSYEDRNALDEYLQVLLNRALRLYPEKNTRANRDLWWETLDWVIPALQEAFQEVAGIRAQKMFTLDWR